MPDLPITERPRTGLLCCCLLGAPLAETIEQILSPLTGGSTVEDFGAIAGASGRFTASVLIGLLGTALLLPALLGLARRGSERSPLIALFAAMAIVASSVGFAGVRMAQAFELQLATGALPRATAAAEFDRAIATPIGSAMTIAFIGGTAVGTVLLAIALWRSHRVPIGSVVLLLIFPLADLALPPHGGPVISHLLLLAAFGWMVAALLRTEPAPDRARRVIGARSVRG